MLHLSSILSSGGMKDWTIAEWTQWFGLATAFLTITVGPFLKTIFSKFHEQGKNITEIGRQVAVADQKATEAQAGVVNANNRIVSVAAMTTPAAQTADAKPTAGPMQVRT